jgi:hypothetical protein
MKKREKERRENKRRKRKKRKRQVMKKRLQSQIRKKMNITMYSRDLSAVLTQFT